MRRPRRGRRGGGAMVTTGEKKGSRSRKREKERERARGRASSLSFSLSLSRPLRADEPKKGERATKGEKKKADAFLPRPCFYACISAAGRRARQQLPHHRRLLRGDGADALEGSGRGTTSARLRRRRCGGAETFPSRQGSSGPRRGGGLGGSHPERGPRGRGFAQHGR